MRFIPFVIYVWVTVLIALVVLCPIVRCFAADTSQKASITRAHSPLRISLGYDGSSVAGSRYGFTSWLGSLVQSVLNQEFHNSDPSYTDPQVPVQQDTPYLVTRQTEAVRLSISYDLLQDRHADWATFAYLEDDDDGIGYVYVGSGLGMRYATGSFHGASLYVGAGAGIYSVWLPGANGVAGYKMFFGLQSHRRGNKGLFLEGGYTHISTDGYTPRLSVVVGTTF